MTIDEMQELRKQLGYSYEMVAQVSGVPLGTVQRCCLESQRVHVAIQLKR